MTNSKLRPVYLIGGVIGLIILIFQIAKSLPDINPGTVLLITLPDMVLFYLAYKTYPAESPVKG